MLSNLLHLLDVLCITLVRNLQCNQVAILHEGDEPGVVTKLTYEELLREVCRVANAMRDVGVKKGDFVTLYMPMVPEAAIAMLACARLGAPHSVVFAGFSAEALRDRIVVSPTRMTPLYSMESGSENHKPRLRFCRLYVVIVVVVVCVSKAVYGYPTHSLVPKASLITECLSRRRQDAKSKWIFTTNEGRRGGKTLHLKKIVDKAVEGVSCVEKVLMFTVTGAEVRNAFCSPLKVLAINSPLSFVIGGDITTDGALYGLESRIASRSSPWVRSDNTV